MGEPFRFGQFEFDSSSGELRRLDGKGPAQRLPPQPARLLGLLVERQGAVVTREEIRERLWPGTHVDFDASLHFCVRQVRAALGDSAAAPGYVENVPRRGYRLKAQVTRVQTGAEPPGDAAAASRRKPWLLALPVVLVALGLAYYAVGRQAAATSPVRIAIMPFQPPDDMRGTGGWQPIAEWILEDLAVLAGPSAAIVGPTTTEAYDGTDAGLRRLADDYDLDFIVNGRFLASETGSSPRMLGELIRTSDSAHVWVRRYDDLSEGQRIGEEIARSVARVLELDVPTDAEPGAR